MRLQNTRGLIMFIIRKIIEIIHNNRITRGSIRKYDVTIRQVCRHNQASMSQESLFNSLILKRGKLCSVRIPGSGEI